MEEWPKKIEIRPLLLPWQLRLIRSPRLKVLFQNHPCPVQLKMKAIASIRNHVSSHLDRVHIGLLLCDQLFQARYLFWITYRKITWNHIRINRLWILKHKKISDSKDCIGANRTKISVSKKRNKAYHNFAIFICQIGHVVVIVQFLHPRCWRWRWSLQV